MIFGINYDVLYGKLFLSGHPVLSEHFEGVRLIQLQNCNSTNLESFSTFFLFLVQLLYIWN